jgi:hypothetical protein
LFLGIANTLPADQFFPFLVQKNATGLIVNENQIIASPNLAKSWFAA